jgi:PadR family transcriptional regulator, regulatory protein AphA
MSTPSRADLTPTSYAMLGLLALRPWTTYELAKQMQRSVRWFWPRAERKLYEEPKRLAALGLATVETTATGRRPSSVYQITATGRRALRDWLRAGPGAPMQVEMEAMIRVFFADGASSDDLRATLIAVGDQARETLATLGELAAGTVSGADDFPQRRATNAVALELWVRLHETVRDWATWAQEEVEGWPPQHRGRREVAAGSPERGAELFAEIVRRIGTGTVT